jgi:hypothetical protein
MIKIRIMIPNNHPKYTEVFEQIEPAFDDYSAFFSVSDDFKGRCVHTYDIDNTAVNSLLATDIALRYPGVECVVEENGIDYEMAAKFI